MHRSISLNTLCFADMPLDASIDAIARLEARGVTPDLEQLIAIGSAKAARLIRDAGLAPAALTHRAFAFDSTDRAEAGRERLARTIDIAADIGARTIIMTTGGRGGLPWGQAVQRFAEAVAPSAELARQAGIALSIEPTSHLYADASIAHRLSDTAGIARTAGISVCIDLFACWFDSDIEVAIADAGPITSIVQVSDYVYGDRGLPCRAVPGDGALPWKNIIPAIVNAQYGGWFDLEIIGPRLGSEGLHGGLRRAGDYLGALLQSAGLTAE